MPGYAKLKTHHQMQSKQFFHVHQVDKQEKYLLIKHLLMLKETTQPIQVNQTNNCYIFF